MASPRSNFAAKSIRFFKIVLTHIGSHTTLMIPRKFERNFGKNLDNRIHLSAPSGSIWSIDLVKHQDKICLQNGWPEFAKFYSIDFGYLLVFEYFGDSKFKLLIFDQNASEIDYLSTSSANPNFVKREIDHVKINTDSGVIRPSKKTRTCSSCIELCDNGQKKLHVKDNGDESACNLEKINALASAKAFKSEHPYFTVSLKPSQLKGNWGLHIPTAFEKVYTKWMNNVEVILQVGGNIWPVYSRLNLEHKRCVFQKGCNVFARDNSLKVGDVCVFELINPSQKLLKVHISSNMRG